MPEEKVVIFIDGPKLDRMEKLLKIKIDYIKLRKFLVDNRQLTNIFYYHERVHLNEEKRNTILQAGYQVIDEFGSAKELDKRLVQDIRGNRGQADCIVLVGGNSNFFTAMEESATKFGRDLEIFCLNEILYQAYKNTSAKIIEPADHIPKIDDSPEPNNHDRPPIPEELQRVVILVDGPNLEKTQKDLRLRFDMVKLRKMLVGNRQRIAAYYYYRTPVYPRNQILIKQLDKLGYKMIPGEHNQDVDQTIINHIAIIAEQGIADTLILVSGDGDYLVALENVAHQYGLNIEIVGAKGCTFGHYAKMPDFKIIDLNSYFDEIVDCKETQKNFGKPYSRNIPVSTEDACPDPKEVEKEEMIMEENSRKPIRRPKPKPQAVKLLDCLGAIFADGSVKKVGIEVVIKGRTVEVTAKTKTNPNLKK